MIIIQASIAIGLVFALIIGIFAGFYYCWRTEIGAMVFGSLLGLTLGSLAFGMVVSTPISFDAASYVKMNDIMEANQENLITTETTTQLAIAQLQSIN